MLTDQSLYDMVVKECMNLGELRYGILVYVVYVQCRSVTMRFTEYRLYMLLYNSYYTSYIMCPYLNHTKAYSLNLNKFKEDI